jgi:C-terminal processing protease CtpA/Prc
VLDYPHKQLFLTPNENFATPLEYNMAGITIRQRPDSSLVVLHVLPDSPANRQGILGGEIIRSINGQMSTAYQYTEIFQLFRQEGKTIDLELEQTSGERRIVTVTLSKLI